MRYFVGTVVINPTELALGQLEYPSNMAALDFETSVSQISGEEKRMFIKFVKKMITWEPKDRKTAKELLDDPWLCTNI